jgi:hypothetical protein
MDVKEIETAIAQLPPAQVAELADWFDEFRARLWDQQIERDLNSGRLQTLLDEARLARTLITTSLFNSPVER